MRPTLLEMVAAAFMDGSVPIEAFTRDILYSKPGLMTDNAAAVAGEDFNLDRAAFDET